MSLFVTKLLSLLIHPLSLGLLLVVAAGLLAWWRRPLGLALLGVGLLVLWIPSTPVFSTWIQSTLEARFPPEPVSRAPTADAIVVLGGAIGMPRPPLVYPDLNEAADRVWHAARLYNAGKAPVIVASGGTLPWKNPHFREASAIEAVLASWGVPADSVLLESESANTYENATHTADLAAEHGFDRILLVTSALHMRRALATFRTVGVDAIPVATDYQVVEEGRTVLDVAPDAEALHRSTAAIHEYVGYLYYEWRGWIAGRRSSTQGKSTGNGGSFLWEVSFARGRATVRLPPPGRSLPSSEILSSAQ